MRICWSNRGGHASFQFMTRTHGTERQVAKSCSSVFFCIHRRLKERGSRKISLKLSGKPVLKLRAHKAPAKNTCFPQFPTCGTLAYPIHRQLFSGRKAGCEHELRRELYNSPGWNVF